MFDKDQAKEITEDVTKEIIIRFTKSVNISQEEVDILKKCIRLELMQALTGQVNI